MPYIRWNAESSDREPSARMQVAEDGEGLLRLRFYRPPAASIEITMTRDQAKALSKMLHAHGHATHRPLHSRT